MTGKTNTQHGSSGAAPESVSTAEAKLEAPAEPSGGLAALAGALADWEDLDIVVEEIYAARQSSVDRLVPDLV